MLLDYTKALYLLDWLLNVFEFKNHFQEEYGLKNSDIDVKISCQF